ncbi:MAG: hypothetical protein Fur0036_00760 [Fimbriimonadaceae bacterium]
MKTTNGQRDCNVQIGTYTDKKYMRVEWRRSDVCYTGRDTHGKSAPFVSSNDEAIARTMKKYRIALRNLAK